MSPAFSGVLKNQKFLISGVMNRKSIAYAVVETLLHEGAYVDLMVQTEDMVEKVSSLFQGHSGIGKIFVCNVLFEEEIVSLGEKLSFQVESHGGKYNGFLHSIAFADYSMGMKPFHETSWNHFQEALHISCFSFISLIKTLRPLCDPHASMVCMSISSTKATNYGYMGPIKAALESTVPFLAKSLSVDSKMRVNAVCAGPLKTSASAGIPGYINGYLFSEQLTLRHEALKTREVSHAVCFLLSTLSSGINASSLVVDGGMSSNYFDEKVMEKYFQS